ncbi:MAG: tyrosine-type recombinase/integrase [Vulcanimicrobiota bacterium]
MAEFTPRYLEFSKHNKSSKSYENDFFATKHLLGYFNSTYLNEISPDKIEDYKLKRVAKVEPVSVNKELNCLRAMLNRAVEWEVLKESPIRKLRRYKEPPGRVRYLTLKEIPSLLVVCAKNILAVVIIALYTGMRKGEITRLRWRDIDEVNGFVHVKSSKNYERRDIPMNEEVKELFRGMARGPEESKIFPKIGDFKKAWWSSLKRAGITDFCFHDLRHTFASHLVMAGVSIMVVIERITWT